MASLPRPLLGALIAVIAAFAVWTVALKPSSSSSSSGSPAAPAQIATTAATHHPASTAASKPHAAAAKAPVHKATSPLARLTAALAAHKVVALLFYNPAGADDQFDRFALKTISTHHGAVVKLAVPVDQLAKYSSITNKVPVTTSPTLIVIDRHRQASTLVGFADPLEFSQFVSAALRVK